MKKNAELKNNVVKLLYKLINNLLYFDDLKKNAIMCVNKDLKT